MEGYLSNGRVYLNIPFANKERAKRISGYRWESNTLWSWPETRVPALRAAFVIDLAVLAKDNADMTGAPVGEKPKAFSKLERFMPKVESFIHQTMATAAIITHRVYALFLEMGLGKTKAVIDAIDYLYLEGIRLVVVFCPKTLIPIWCEEIEKYGTYMVAVPITFPTLKSISKIMDAARDAKKNSHVTVLVIGYDKGARIIAARAGIFNEAEMVVLDESQKIKTHNSMRTKAILGAFAHRDIRKVIMSGTPITQNALDLWAQLHFLSQKITNQKSYYGFRNRYAVMEQFRNFSKVIGFRNLDELKRLIAPYAYELRKDQIDDLKFPDRMYMKRVLEMPPAMKKQYKDMRDNLLIELKEMENITASIALTKILRLQEVTAGHYLECWQDNHKVEELRDLLQGELAGKKVVVWCRFLKSIKLVEEMVKQEGRTALVLTGDTKDRGALIYDFQNSKTADIFIGQIATGGVGITLTAADNCVYYENSFSMAERKQSEDRIHRIGQQSNKCTYLDLVYKGTIDEKVLRVLDQKGDFATEIVKSFSKGEWAI